jgi:hypothetical protein
MDFNTPYSLSPARDHHQWQRIAYYMVQQQLMVVLCRPKYVWSVKSINV